MGKNPSRLFIGFRITIPSLRFIAVMFAVCHVAQFYHHCLATQSLLFETDRWFSASTMVQT